MDDYYSIEFTSSVEIGDDDEASYITSIHGSVLRSDSNSKRRRRVGRLRLYYVDLERAEADRVHPFDILDTRAETYDFYPTLFDAKTGEYKRNVSRLVGDIYHYNLLILSRVEILPAYRGRGLGLASLYLSMQQYRHGCGLVALKCFPLQFELSSPESGDNEWARRMKLGTMGDGLMACKQKLLDYYSRLGFVRIGKTEFMILNPAFVQPSFESLGFSEEMN